MRNSHQVKRCFHSHPPLKIGDKVIYGGSCIEPAVLDADVYVGFDMSMKTHTESYPWSGKEAFLFPIVDGSVPKSISDTIKLVEWLALQLTANKKVHIGCIGGHGRTGLILAALVKHITGNSNAIEYVRKNYCEKAVETEKQMVFLQEHFGIIPIAPSKEHFGHLQLPKREQVPVISKPINPSLVSTKIHGNSYGGVASIWGDNVKFD